jgi:hypothetical protein
MNKLFKISLSLVFGLVLGCMLSNVPIAAAAVGAILDTINRGYFVATGTYNMTVGTSGTGTFRLVAAGTPVAVVDSTGITMQAGKGVNQAVYVPTFAATPAAGTNDIKKGFNAIPTAAANTAACLPAVPVAGDVFEGMNTMANSVRVKACGTPGINGAAAGTYFPVAAATYFRCVASSATAYQCGTLAVPTPAGP